METYEIKFQSAILRRGFWIYVVQITDSKGKKYYYVGRTGDSSSVNAASLFVRLGRHFENKKKAKGNTLWRAIEREEIDKDKLSFQIVGFYLQKEEKQKEKYQKIIKEISCVEDKLHKDLEKVVGEVLGTQWKNGKGLFENSEKQYDDIVSTVNEKFGLKVKE